PYLLNLFGDMLSHRLRVSTLLGTHACSGICSRIALQCESGDSVFARQRSAVRSTLERGWKRYCAVVVEVATDAKVILVRFAKRCNKSTKTFGERSHMKMEDCIHTVQ
ncbi:MAG: hypothetical protein WBH55_06570, partial [Bacteroidota bacterium]